MSCKDGGGWGGFFPFDLCTGKLNGTHCTFTHVGAILVLFSGFATFFCNSSKRPKVRILLNFESTFHLLRPYKARGKECPDPRYRLSDKGTKLQQLSDRPLVKAHTSS